MTQYHSEICPSNQSIEFYVTHGKLSIDRSITFMKLHHSTSDIFIPDGTLKSVALQRVTHLGIGAHQDDLEFMAFHGILECFAREDRWFGGVTCTDGAGSSRSGPYVDFSDARLMATRRQEQKAAAVIGDYGVMIQLDYPSSVVKSPKDQNLQQDLKSILLASRPQIVYTHNLADKHDTHLGVTIATLLAIRELPAAQRPKQVIGCEVWRNLDWLPDERKILMNVSGRDNLAAALNGVFDSQIAGGKRYDLAIAGRRAANATFFDSHTTDVATQVIYGLDLTPLIIDESRDIINYVSDLIVEFQADVSQKLSQRLGRI
jgi:LmbE family N-acetylglucosaminyl deacetylase